MFAQKRIDDAVSPVVGVILMVAVTVILAAVIGSFVLDLGNNVQANPQAGVTFDQDASAGEVTVQLVSMENADSVDVNRPDGSTAGTLSSVGDTVTVSAADSGGTALSDGDKITVIGHLEGKSSVLQTYKYSA